VIRIAVQQVQCVGTRNLTDKLAWPATVSGAPRDGEIFGAKPGSNPDATKLSLP
jgi:hypothetical protein